jgi:hypothetical protein
MPTEKELEMLGNTELAVLCGKIAADATKYAESAAAKAFNLKQEWASVQTSPSSVWKEKESKEVELASWRKRTIEFLAVIL